LDDQLVPLLRKTLKTVVSIIIFLWMIQLMGYKVSALLAGLGIGGLAVALALQDTLANLFASIIILLDQPFRVGDRIVVENTDGVVEEIGLRSTRIRTLSKTLVSIPNKIVSESTIDNIDKMPKRKISQVIGITYDTTASQMEQVLVELKKIISDDKGIDKDFFVVRFTDFGDSSLNIEIIYFTVTVDYDAHLAVKEKINLAIMRKIEELGLSMAFPSRTVYIKNEQ
ncbi:MAG: mechanosensitive ion channel family protein, partial [Alphaproteobacteria bacterium]